MGPACSGKLLVGLLQSEAAASAGAGCQHGTDAHAFEGRPSRSPRLALARSILAAGGRRPCPSLRLPVEDLGASLSFAPEFALAAAWATGTAVHAAV
jgi:hypothetical protein